MLNRLKRIFLSLIYDISLRFSLNMTILISLLVATLSCGYMAYNFAKEQKLEDAWAIYFLNLEHLSQGISKKIQRYYQLTDEQGSRSILSQDFLVAPPDYLIEITDGRLQRSIQGDLLQDKDLEKIFRKRPARADEMTIFRHNGRDFLGIVTDHNQASLAFGQALRQGRYFLIWRVDFNKIINPLYDPPSEDSRLYLVSRSGQLVYTSDKRIHQQYVEQSENLRLFISSPLNQGNFEFRRGENILYGFFQKIPSTNVVLFSEVEKREILAQLDLGRNTYLTYLVVIASLTMLVLQLIFSYLFNPIKRLSLDALRLSHGDFSVPVAVHGFGELRALASSFDRMRVKLIEREQEVASLHQEQLEKKRMEIELSLASEIQNHLMHRVLHEQQRPVEIIDYYQPANEIAGDWFSYTANEQATVIAIADVSGHGVGSALFTSILSSHFVEHFMHDDDYGSPLDFIRQIEHSFATIGKGRMHATLSLAEIDHQQKMLRFYNCGHVTSFLLNADKKVKSLALPSSPLGLGLPLKIGRFQCSLQGQERLFMYTDCLIEQSRSFRGKRLKKLLFETSDLSPKQVQQRFLHAWKKEAAHKIEDDLCIIIAQCRFSVDQDA